MSPAPPHRGFAGGCPQPQSHQGDPWKRRALLSCSFFPPAGLQGIAHCSQLGEQLGFYQWKRQQQQQFLTWCGAGAEHGGTGRAAHELQTGCSAPKTCRKSSLQRSRTARPGRGRQGAPGGDKAGGWRVSVLSTTCSSSAGETCQHQLLCSSVPWGCLTAAKRKKKKTSQGLDTLEYKALRANSRLRNGAWH